MSIGGVILYIWRALEVIGAWKVHKLRFQDLGGIWSIRSVHLELVSVALSVLK